MSHERVADSAQEVFLKCLEPHGVLERANRDRGRFRAYLYGVVRNVARRALRERRNGVAEMPSEVLDEQTASPAEVFDREWAAAIGREALELLVERSRGNPRRALQIHVLWMRNVDELPARDIGSRLGIPDVKDVYQLIQTGRRQFERALLEVVGRYYPDTSPAGLEERCREIGSFF